MAGSFKVAQPSRGLRAVAIPKTKMLTAGSAIVAVFFLACHSKRKCTQR